MAGKQPLSRCPSGKRRFKDELGAKIALSSTDRRAGATNRRGEKRFYRCPLCGGYHLTKT